MKRICLSMAILLCISFFLPMRVGAKEEETDALDEIGEVMISIPDRLPEQVKELIPEPVLEEFYKGEEGDLLVIGQGLAQMDLWSLVRSAISGALSGAAKLLSVTVGFCVIAGIIGAMAPEGGTRSVMSYLLILVCSLLLSRSVQEGFLVLKETLTTITVLIRALLPCIGALCLLSGNVTTAAIEEVWLGLILEVIEVVMTSVIAPLLLFSFLLSIASAVAGGGRLAGLSKSITGSVSLVLGFAVTIMTALLSHQHSIAVQTDGMLMHTVKFAASGVIPVIGSSMGDVLSGAVGAAGILRGSVGTITTGGIIAVMLSPLITLFSMRMALRISDMLAFALGLEREGGLFREVTGVFDLMLALLLICLILLLFTMTLTVNAVSI